MTKRLFDIILSLLLLILFLPLFFFISVFIYLTMGKPIFFKQNRPGLNKKAFTIYKFRTMTNKKDSQGNLLPDEERLYGVGKFIRSASLDEIPQLFNVLNGNMSFVGPRPLLLEYLPLYTQEQNKRHNVRPGITGWAQVNGRNTISWEEKFELDVWYVENQSLLLDLKILFMTFMKVINRSDISSSSSVTMEKFKG